MRVGARAQRARGHVRMENFEMLKMTWFVLSFVQIGILSNFKFFDLDIILKIAVNGP